MDSMVKGSITEILDYSPTMVAFPPALTPPLTTKINAGIVPASNFPEEATYVQQRIPFRRARRSRSRLHCGCRRSIRRQVEVQSGQKQGDRPTCEDRRTSTEQIQDR